MILRLSSEGTIRDLDVKGPNVGAICEPFGVKPCPFALFDHASFGCSYGVFGWSRGGFLEQTLHHFFHLDLVAGCVALVGHADIPFAINQRRERIVSIGVVLRDDTAFGVEQDAKGVAVSVDQRADLGDGLGFIDAHCDDLKTLALVLFVHLLKVRQFFEAGRTPRRPKIQQDDFAAQRIEALGVAAQVA